MIHLSQQTEMLAWQLAAARGVSVEEAVKLAIEESSKEIGQKGRRASPGEESNKAIGQEGR